MKKMLDRIFGIPVNGIDEEGYKKAYLYLNETKAKPLGLAKERLQMEEVQSESQCFKLAEMLEDGIPLILNFEGMDIKEANKVIYFLSGVIYMIDGVIKNIDGKIFLFTDKSNLEDKSIEDFLNQMK